MHLTFISIFPEIFDSFFSTSLIAKAQEKGLVSMTTINPRDFCTDKHRQVDDEIYGGGKGMLIKAEPMIQALKHALKIYGQKDTKIIMPAPSPTIFDQNIAHRYAETCQHCIFVCGRYEGIDHRFVQYCTKKYPDTFSCLSLGHFVTMGGEVPAMTMTEAILRLVPGVIKESESWQKESYMIEKNMQNIEYPQYTRPENVRGMAVPEVLLSGHHQRIDEWREEMEKQI